MDGRTVALEQRDDHEAIAESDSSGAVPTNAVTSNQSIADHLVATTNPPDSMNLPDQAASNGGSTLPFLTQVAESAAAMSNRAMAAFSGAGAPTLDGHGPPVAEVAALPEVQRAEEQPSAEGDTTSAEGGAAGPTVTLGGPSAPGEAGGGAGGAPSGGETGNGIDGPPEGAPAAGAEDGTVRVGEIDAGALLEGEVTDEAPPTPQDDPAFQSLQGALESTATATKSHEPAKSAAGAAQASAKSPTKERASIASAGKAAATEAAESPSFDTAAFAKKVMDKVQASAPKSMSEAKDAGGKLDQTKGELNQVTEEQQTKATGKLQEENRTPPDPGTVPERKPTALQEQQPGPLPVTPPPTGAVPPPQSDAAVVGDTLETSADIDQQLADQGVSEQTLADSNEPQFQTALAEKKGAQAAVKAAPAQFRREEAQTASSAREQGQATLAAGIEGMHADRTGSLQQVGQSQAETVNADEAKRAEVTAAIEGIYRKTKERVDARLAALDKEVAAAFDEGIAAAKQAFEDYYDAFIDDRYSGISGKLLWAKEKLFGGLAGPVEGALKRAQAIFIEQMTGAVHRVAAIVGAGLTEAKQIVAEGRAEITEYVNSLPTDLQCIGQEAANNIESKFADLEASIDAKENALVDSIAAQYTAAATEITNRMEEIKAASKSLVERARNLVVGVINAIRNLKNLLLNVLSSVGDAVANIIADPMKFLGNLIAGAKQGLDDFIGGIWDHLQTALMDWLFGAMAGAGITMPDKLNTEGMLSIVMQILGITYQNIRARAVALLGEGVVERLEQFAEPIIVLIKEGPGGLWDWVKEKLAAVADTVLEGIKSFLIEKVIKAGVMWIVSLLNPAAAFIKACKLIYDIVMFFVEKGKQLIELVQAFIAGVADVARGNVGGIATKVKDALVSALSLAINLLARILGLGGISKKVKAIIEKVQAPVNEAMDWLIQKAVNLVKAAGKLVGIGEEAEVEGAPAEAAAVSTGDPERDSAVAEALADMRATVSAIEEGGRASRTEVSEALHEVVRRHPVLSRLEVADGGARWNLLWAASPPTEESGPLKEEADGSQVDMGAVFSAIIEHLEKDDWLLELETGALVELVPWQQRVRDMIRDHPEWFDPGHEEWADDPGGANVLAQVEHLATAPESQVIQLLHMLPRAAMRNLPGYDPRHALTLPFFKEAHARFDRGWKSVFQNWPDKSQATVTAKELYDTVAAAADATPDFSPQLKRTIKALLKEELFFQLGLSEDDPVRRPYYRG